MCVTPYGLFQFSHLLAIMCLPAICITSAFLAYSMARPQLHLLLMLPAVMATPTAWKNRKEGLIVWAVILAASLFGSLRALIPIGIGSAARSWSNPNERYVCPQSPEPITIRSNMFGIPRTFDTVHFSKFSGVPTATLGQSNHCGSDKTVPFNFVSGLLPLSVTDAAIGVPSNMTAIAYQSFLVQIVHTTTSENCRAVLQDGKLRSDVYMLAAFNMTTGSTARTILPFDVRYWTTVTCYPLISPVLVTFFVLGCILTSVSAWIMADPAHTNMYLAMSEGYEAVLGRFTNLLHKSEYRVFKVNGNFAIVLKPQNKHCQGYLSYGKAREVLHIRIKEEKKERRRAEQLLRSGALDSYRMRSKPETVFGTVS
ncbi:hypothetical protein HDU78_010398 [Chytriomyces hyalinus]|nr:hypothetical protein HDU78_010398 [Chytriomyces hyalinus]